MSLIDHTGRPMLHRTEATFPLREMEMLAALSDKMQQLGITLVCIKCGGPIQGNNPPDSDTFTLSCQCAVRLCHRGTGKVKVAIH